MRKFIKIGLLLITFLMVVGCTGRRDGQTIVSAESSICLLTYNIHHGVNANNVLNIDATIETLRKSGANIIALQEVDRVWGDRSQYYDEAKYIAEKLGMNFVFGVTLDKDTEEPGVGEYGVAILSKFAIIANEFYLLPSELEQRGILSCTLRTGRGDVQVCCTHLGLSSTERANQITAMLQWLPQQEDLLILGDFNTTPDAEELQPLYSRFGDLQEKYGLGGTGTYYYNNQWVRSDYIYSGSKWRPVACRVIDSQASDHLPVYVEVDCSDVREH